MLKFLESVTRCAKRVSARRLAGRPIRRGGSRAPCSSWRRSHGATRINYIRPHVERLEERRVLAAVVVDLGALAGAADVLDVAVQDNGEILAVANVTGSNGAPNGAELLRFDSNFNLLDHQQIVGLGGETRARRDFHQWRMDRGRVEGSEHGIVLCWSGVVYRRCHQSDSGWSDWGGRFVDLRRQQWRSRGWFGR